MTENHQQSESESKRKTSTFLKKRLEKGIRYFDSGEYNMKKSSRSKDENDQIIETKPAAYNRVDTIKHKSSLPKSSLASSEEDIFLDEIGT